MQIIEGIRRGKGLDFSVLINTPSLKKIWDYLLQSGSKQMLEKLMAKNPDSDLSCLDEEDELMLDSEAKGGVVMVIKGIKKFDDGITAATGSEQVGDRSWGKNRKQDLRSRVQSVMWFGGSLILEVKKGVSLLTSHPSFCNFKTF